jgi:putative ABC transport system substrate-binding protein
MVCAVRKAVLSILVVVVLLAVAVVADAQQSEKIFRIGFLDSSTPSGIAVLVEALRQDLRKLGWTKGKNVIIEFRFAEQKPDRLPQLAAELVRLNVDVIVAPAGPSVLAAKEATKTIPIVMTNPADPVGEGMVASLTRPGELNSPSIHS